MTNKKLATFRIDASKWQAFQQWAKRSGSNASALLVEYIEECLDTAPTRRSIFPLNQTANNIDERIGSIDERLKLLEASVERRVKEAIEQQIAYHLAELASKSEKSQP
ncbi:hypothetical protein H6S82_00245 [Planktothrix sp. FACHB-1355]|uniref:Uncharacterized protein n=1 Tax=Aerosakkonema funiforme FACHB-1375 TaxID=2949571 RepID=A0A926ZG74_9CYAN|nr:MULTISPECIES: hypothetical protein [Oscillatoriales]MBD2181883.1 hypothetical protein [Aerosakkonema funiforme FACHB-1375]MBD3557303.1 hypothetical protein [Planktothrix sp. FACHB-1355]